MIYYAAVFIFVMVTLLFYVAIERKNEQKMDGRSSSHKEKCDDLYIFALNDAIMRGNLKSGINNR